MKSYHSYQDVPSGVFCRPEGCFVCLMKKEEWIFATIPIKPLYLFGRWEAQSTPITITEEEALAKIEKSLISPDDMHAQFVSGARWAIKELFR